MILYMDCPECGKMIPSDAETCPHCGKTITEEDKQKQEDYVHCPHCGRKLSPCANVCPECGHPFEDDKVKENLNGLEPHSTVYIKSNNVFWKLLAFFILVAVLVFVGHFVYCWVKKSNTHAAKNQEQVEAHIANKDNRNGVGSHNGHLWVDLGLPSGTLWATCDVGAPYPGQRGDFFAWGEIQPKKNYSWGSYSYEDESGRITKYNIYDDYLIRLQPSDDAATVNWGDGWRMPTAEEFKELYEWCMRGNNNEYIGPNGNVIRLGGSYWSSSLDTKNDREAIVFGNSSVGDRCDGYCVRPVYVASRN